MAKNVKTAIIIFIIIIIIIIIIITSFCHLVIVVVIVDDLVVVVAVLAGVAVVAGLRQLDDRVRHEGLAAAEALPELPRH